MRWALLVSTSYEKETISQWTVRYLLIVYSAFPRHHKDLDRCIQKYTAYISIFIPSDTCACEYWFVNMFYTMHQTNINALEFIRYSFSIIIKKGFKSYTEFNKTNIVHFYPNSTALRLIYQLYITITDLCFPHVFQAKASTIWSTKVLFPYLY